MMNVLNYQIVQVRVTMGPEQSYDTLHTELLLILRVFMQFNPSWAPLSISMAIVFVKHDTNRKLKL